MKKSNLNIDIILNKKFETQISGYDATEVDKYLDQIIEDYQNFNDYIETLERKLEEKISLVNQKESTIGKLQIEIQNLKDQIKEVSKTTNYEIMQELREIKKQNAQK